MTVIKHFVDGKTFEGSSKRTGKVFNPATGEQASEVNLASKQDVDLAVEKLAPISNEMSRLMQDTSEIDKILARGAERGRSIAAPILAKTYDIVGMLR